MRPATRLLLALVLLLAAAAPAPGQNVPPEPAPAPRPGPVDAVEEANKRFSKTKVFAFAPRPGPDVVKGEDANEIPKELNATENITLRPNTAAEFYLYVYNPKGVEQTYVVDLKGLPGTKLAVQQQTMKIPEKHWARVRLPKLVPPPAEASGPAPAAANQPGSPPPGAELNGAGGRFSFTLRLLDETNRTEIPGPDDKPYGRAVAVDVRQPQDYVVPPTVTLEVDRLSRVVVTVGPREVGGKPVFTGSADVRLSFPSQLLAGGGIIRQGFYRRTLVVGPRGFEPAKLTGAVENPRGELRVDVGVDGFDRAFIYKPGRDAGAGGMLIRDHERAVRVYPAAGFATGAASRPVAGFPVRVEVDNPPPPRPRDATLELWVRPPRPGGAGDDAAATEVIHLGGPREERVWLDPAGAFDQGLLFTNQSRDWVKSIDLAALRGRQEVVGVLKVWGEEPVRSPPLAVVLDATPPERVTFVELPEKHVRGKPLPVRAEVADPETDVVKAVFFLGKPLDDGKPPPGATLADGKPADGKPGAWEAELPLPAEKKGEAVVGVVFTNEAGLSATKTQRVELVDAPPPAGAVDGVVRLGDLAQPGVAVSLRAADGKERTTTTDARGRFKFENVPPGGYTVASSRADSSYGTAGTAPVQVEPDRRAKVSVELKKQVR